MIHLKREIRFLISAETKSIQANFFQGLSKEHYEDLSKGMREFEKLSSGNVNDVNWEKLKPIYGRIAEDIGFQKKRIGGNFVVANAVTSREMRNKRFLGCQNQRE